MQKIQVPNLQILICLLEALMNQTTIYFSFLNQTIFSHLSLFGFHFCPAWRLVRWDAKANKKRRSKASVQRLNDKTQWRRKFLYTVQQSFESIEAKHMQNAWQPVKGYLQKKNMTLRSLTHIFSHSLHSHQAKDFKYAYFNMDHLLCFYYKTLRSFCLLYL